MHRYCNICNKLILFLLKYNNRNLWSYNYITLIPVFNLNKLRYNHLACKPDIHTFIVYILATILNIIVTYITYVYSVYIYDFATWGVVIIASFSYCVTMRQFTYKNAKNQANGLYWLCVIE